MSKKNLKGPLSLKPTTVQLDRCRQGEASNVYLILTMQAQRTFDIVFSLT